MTDLNNTGADNIDVNNPDFSKGGENTQKSIKDGEQALKIAQRLEYNDQKRDFERARVLAAFNGNAPYDEGEMQAAAQAYRFNVSFGFLEGVIGRATAPYEELVSDNQYIANIEGDIPDEKRNIMREEFADIVKQWGKWPKFTSRLIQDLLLYGYNNAIFPSDYDPWPLFIPQKDAYVHELTMNEVEDLELFVWKKSYLIHELYAKIEDAESAKKAGWDIENVRKALEDATPKDIFQRQVGGAWTALEEAIRGGTLFYSMVGGKQIDAFHVFASELDGKVTHYIVYNGRGRESDPASSPGVTLFKREGRWDSFSDFLVYFDLEAGDGKWHGSKGLGRRAFNTHRSLDKLRCAILDQAFVSGLTLLQPGDSGSNEDFQLAVTGPFAVIPPGISISSTTLPAISNQTFQADSLLSMTVEQRIGDVVPNTLNPMTGGKKTATQSTIDANRQQLISKGNLKRFLNPLSKMVSIMVKRLLKENSPDPYAKTFQKALIDKGFTPEDFKKVRGAKSTGSIDTIMGNDTANMDMLLQFYRGDGDVDQHELKRRQIAAHIGAKEADGLLIPNMDRTKELEATRQQREEIATMIVGIPVDASPRDLQEVHAAVAVDWLMGQLQHQLSGAGGGASISVIDMVAKHTKQHIEYLNTDQSKKNIVHQLDAQMRQIGHAVDNMEKAALAHAKQAGIVPNAPAPAEQSLQSV